MNDLKQKTKKAFLWDFTGKISGQIVGFIISIFLARILSPENFGVLAMVNVIIALSSTLTDMGLGIALIQRKDVKEEHYTSVFYFNITIGIILSLTLLSTSGYIAEFYKNESVADVARVMSAIFVLNSIGLVLRLKLRRDLDYAIPTQANLIAAVLSGIIGVVMALKDFGIWSLVAQSLSNPIIANFWLFYRIKWRPVLKFNFVALKELWSFGFRMFLSGLLNSLLTNIDSLIVGRLFAPATLGFFYRAKSLNNLVIQYSSDSLMSVLFPVISKLQLERERLKEVVYRSFHILNFIAFFLGGILYSTGEDIIVLLFSAKWYPTVPIFKILIMSSYAYPISSLLVNIISGLGNSRGFLKLEVIKVTLFSVNLVIGFYFGLNGYLYGYAIASFFGVLANMFYAAIELQVKTFWFIKITVPYMLLALFTVFEIKTLDHFFQINGVFHFVVVSCVFLITYVCLARLFKMKGLTLLLNEMFRIKQFEKIRIMFGYKSSITS